MPLNFPDTPTLNQTFTSGSRTWSWDGTTWVLGGEFVPNGSITTEKLANNSVTSAKIVDGEIINADIATNAAINTTKITNWENDQVILTSQIF